MAVAAGAGESVEVEELEVEVAGRVRAHETGAGTCVSGGEAGGEVGADAEDEARGA